MAYQHDIFISYRRNKEVLQWITDHFVPLLKANVQFELGFEPDVFVDDQLEAGGAWPLTLAKAIGGSRIIIPLWTKTYLDSQWCTLEVVQMLQRDKLTGFRTEAKPYSLILPVVIHDGETMPAEFSLVQRIEIKNFFTLRMHKDSEAAEKLSQALYARAQDIANAIKRAPDWKADWAVDASNQFFQQYYRSQESVQSDLPKYASV